MASSFLSVYWTPASYKKVKKRTEQILRKCCEKKWTNRQRGKVEFIGLSAEPKEPKIGTWSFEKNEKLHFAMKPCLLSLLCLVKSEPFQLINHSRKNLKFSFNKIIPLATTGL